MSDVGCSVEDRSTQGSDFGEQAAVRRQ